jgi:hypothetical protein
VEGIEQIALTVATTQTAMGLTNLRIDGRHVDQGRVARYLPSTSSPPGAPRQSVQQSADH